MEFEVADALGVVGLCLFVSVGGDRKGGEGRQLTVHQTRRRVPGCRGLGTSPVQAIFRWSLKACQYDVM